jgi:CheY-like chemotaxis protein
LWDRRSPVARRADADRRRGERRSASRPHGSERRAGADRRRDNRRSSSDRRVVASRRHGRRRRETPTPFTVQQIEELKARFASPGPVRCPACGGSFTLGPARRRGTDVARRVACLGCGRAAVVPHSRPARILVIDQNSNMRDSLQGILTDAGHEVIEAADAAVGLVAYQTVPADVVIIDVLSPGHMAAPDFLRQLRRLFPEARVVAMAGRPSYRVVDPLAVSQGLGAARTIRMPFSRNDLLRVIEEVRP